MRDDISNMRCGHLAAIREFLIQERGRHEVAAGSPVPGAPFDGHSVQGRIQRYIELRTKPQLAIQTADATKTLENARGVARARYECHHLSDMILQPARLPSVGRRERLPNPVYRL